MSFGYTLVEGDQPLLQTTVKKRSDRTVQDLTSLTTRQIRYWQNKGVVTTAAATVATPSNGIATYQIASPLDAGTLFWEWLLSDGTNPKIATDPKGDPFQIKVRRRA